MASCSPGCRDLCATVPPSRGGNPSQGLQKRSRASPAIRASLSQESISSVNVTAGQAKQWPSTQGLSWKAVCQAGAEGTEAPFQLGLEPQWGCSEPLSLAEAQNPDSIIPSLAYSSPFLLSGVRWRTLLWSRATAAEYPWALCGERSQLQQLREGALQKRCGRGCHQAAQEGLERVQLSLGSHTTIMTAHSQMLGEGPTQDVQVRGGRPELKGFIGGGPGQQQAGLPGATPGLRASPAGSRGTAPASCSLKGREPGKVPGQQDSCQEGPSQECLSKAISSAGSLDLQVSQAKAEPGNQPAVRAKHSPDISDIVNERRVQLG